MMRTGLALRSAAMCFRAWRAYCCPGPVSSDAIRLMATCASVKIVTCFGVVFLLEVDSSARARAAHSADSECDEDEDEDGLQYDFRWHRDGF